jgi:hypothetical protein
MGDRDHDPEADGDQQPDAGPDRPDRRQHPRLPERKEDATDEQHVADQVDPHPLHAIPLLGPQRPQGRVGSKKQALAPLGTPRV